MEQHYRIADFVMVNSDPLLPT